MCIHLCRELVYIIPVARRMDGFKLYVSNTSTTPPSANDLCYKDAPGYLYTDVLKTISCYQLGQYVIYYDDTVDRIDNGSVIELCYVSINGKLYVTVHKSFHQYNDIIEVIYVPQTKTLTQNDRK